MQQRGRKSLASLALISASGIETVQRPEAPPELSDEQAVEWGDVVNRLPADWFGRETHALLAAYCRHAIAIRKVAQLIAAMEAAPPEDFDLRAYDRLLKMQERESRALASLATKMRISQQTTYDKTKKKPPTVSLPWDRTRSRSRPGGD